MSVKNTSPVCQLSIASASLDKTTIDKFIQCEIDKYGPQAGKEISSVFAQALGVGNKLINKVQGDFSGDMTRAEADIQKVEQAVRSFIAQALSGAKEIEQDLDKLAQKVLDEAAADLDRLIDKEKDKLIHSLSPIIAWICVIAFAFHLHGGVFEKLPVSYRLLISLLVVVTVPIEWRSKVDRLAVPVALGLFASIIYLNK